MNIREIAKRANVSVSTVSRTVNKTGAVDPELARRVHRVIEEVGYFPSKEARSLVSRRSRLLGLIVSDITNPFFPDIVQSFEEVAVPAGFEVLVSSTNYDACAMALSVRRMLERKVEGVAIMTSEMEKSLISDLTSRKVPLAFIDVGFPAPLVSNFRIDYREGIQQAIRHLVRHKHKQIAFVSGPLSLSSARVRRQAFLDCLRENDVDPHPELIIEGDHSMEGGLHSVSKLLGAPQLPTAILASNDVTAIGILAGLNREGLLVPRDMSVVGFDDIHFAQFTIPALTTIRLPRRQLARQVFDALYRDIQGGDNGAQGTEHRVGTTLIVRSSTSHAFPSQN